MPYMKEHIDAGLQTSLVVVGLLLWAYTRGFIPTHHDLVGLSVLAVIGIVIGSDLPDIDAKSAPISKMFQIVVPGAVVLVLLGTLGLWPPFALLLGAIALWLCTKRMPRHRGSVHTIRAALAFGAITTAVVNPILHDLVLSIWAGLCLAIGHLIHLYKDRWIRV